MALREDVKLSPQKLSRKMFGQVWFRQFLFLHGLATMIDDDDDELPPSEYLRDLSERLRSIPVMYGTNGYDIDRLEEIASDLSPPESSGTEAT